MFLTVLSEYYKLAKKCKSQSNTIYELRKKIANMNEDRRNSASFPGVIGKSTLIAEEKEKLKKDLEEQKSINNELQRKLNDEILSSSKQNQSSLNTNRKFHSEFSFRGSF